MPASTTKDARKERAGVYLGTGLGGARTMEAGYADIFLEAKDRVSPFTVVRAMNNAAAAHVSIDFGCADRA